MAVSSAPMRRVGSAFPPASIGNTRFAFRSHGYTPFCTPWRDGRQLPVEDGRVQLDDCCLLHLPETTATTVSVVDAETGQAVAGAKVVFLGARTGKAAGTTDGQGRLSLDVENGRQIVAIEKEGYQHLFQGLESVDQLPRFAMRRPTSAPHVPRDSVTRFTIPQLQGIGRQLLDSIPAPRGGATTFNRCSLYFRGLAAVAPADAIRILSASDANLPSQESLLAYCVSDIVEVDPPYAARLTGAITDQWYRCFHWINLARDESDLDVRTEYVSEALIAARQLAGDRYLTAMANVAMLLWELGNSTEARDVVREAWDRSPELQALVASGARNDRVPASPSFAAAWGLVDPEAAMAHRCTHRTSRDGQVLSNGSAVAGGRQQPRSIRQDDREVWIRQSPGGRHRAVPEQPRNSRCRRGHIACPTASRVDRQGRNPDYPGAAST